MPKLPKGSVRLWIDSEPEPDEPDDRLQIVISKADAMKQPERGSTKRFVVTDLLTGKRIRLRRADCGLGCQCALKRA